MLERNWSGCPSGGRTLQICLKLKELATIVKVAHLRLLIMLNFASGFFLLLTIDNELLKRLASFHRHLLIVRLYLRMRITTRLYDRSGKNNLSDFILANFVNSDSSESQKGFTIH